MCKYICSLTFVFIIDALFQVNLAATLAVLFSDWSTFLRVVLPVMLSVTWFELGVVTRDVFSGWKVCTGKTASLKLCSGIDGSISVGLYSPWLAIFCITLKLLSAVKLFRSLASRSFNLVCKVSSILFSFSLTSRNLEKKSFVTIWKLRSTKSSLFRIWSFEKDSLFSFWDN